GQYLEWTLPHAKPDARGTRRFFTIASSPTEPVVRLGVRLYDKPSSFKRALVELRPGDTMVAQSLSGEFVLPKDASKKLAFIAGGIGITPFRSHLQYLLDRKEVRDITIIYANKAPDHIAYAPLLAQAAEHLGTKIVHVVGENPEEGMHHGRI